MRRRPLRGRELARFTLSVHDKIRTLFSFALPLARDLDIAFHVVVRNLLNPPDDISIVADGAILRLFRKSWQRIITCKTHYLVLTSTRDVVQKYVSQGN